jgi:hypothetical protein
LVIFKKCPKENNRPDLAILLAKENNRSNLVTLLVNHDVLLTMPCVQRTVVAVHPTRNFLFTSKIRFTWKRKDLSFFSARQEDGE